MSDDYDFTWGVCTEIMCAIRNDFGVPSLDAITDFANELNERNISPTYLYGMMDYCCEGIPSDSPFMKAVYHTLGFVCDKLKTLKKEDAGE